MSGPVDGFDSGALAETDASFSASVDRLLRLAALTLGAPLHVSTRLDENGARDPFARGTYSTGRGEIGDKIANPPHRPIRG